MLSMRSAMCFTCLPTWTYMTPVLRPSRTCWSATCRVTETRALCSKRTLVRVRYDIVIHHSWAQVTYRLIINIAYKSFSGYHRYRYIWNTVRTLSSKSQHLDDVYRSPGSTVDYFQQPLGKVSQSAQAARQREIAHLRTKISCITGSDIEKPEDIKLTNHQLPVPEFNTQFRSHHEYPMSLSDPGLSCSEPGRTVIPRKLIWITGPDLKWRSKVFIHTLLDFKIHRSHEERPTREPKSKKKSCCHDETWALEISQGMTPWKCWLHFHAGFQESVPNLELLSKTLFCWQDFSSISIAINLSSNYSKTLTHTIWWASLPQAFHNSSMGPLQTSGRLPSSFCDIPGRRPGLMTDQSKLKSWV